MVFGIFGVFFRSPVLGSIRMSGWYLSPMLGFGGVFYFVADQSALKFRLQTPCFAQTLSFVGGLVPGLEGLDC